MAEPISARGLRFIMIIIIIIISKIIIIIIMIIKIIIIIKMIIIFFTVNAPSWLEVSVFGFGSGFRNDRNSKA